MNSKHKRDQRNEGRWNKREPGMKEASGGDRGKRDRTWGRAIERHKWHGKQNEKGGQRI